MKKSKYRWIYIIAFILVALITVFFIFGAERSSYFEALDATHPDAKWLINQPIAHRGYHNEKTAPENSLEAFSEAIKKGYAIELDVLLSKDDYVIVVHDKNLERLTGADIDVSDMTLDQIKHLTLLDTQISIPTLEEALELINGKVPILLEIKSTGLSHHLDELTYSIIKGYEGEIAVQSFNAASIRWFMKNAPDITRGLILSGNIKFDIANKFIDNLYMLYSNPNFVSYKYNNLLKTDFSELRKDGLIVLGWTVNESMLNTREFVQYCDNIILEANK